jgi:hypothetical protein
VGSGEFSAFTSSCARDTRSRTVENQTSVTAPHAATNATDNTNARARRLNASAAIAATQSSGCNGGRRPGASSSSGVVSAAIAARSGATHGANPRCGPTAARPDVMPTNSTVTAARNNVTCHASQSPQSAPNAGSWIPRASSRRMNGPTPAASSTPTNAWARDRGRTPSRSAVNNARSNNPLVIASAPAFAVKRPPGRTKKNVGSNNDVWSEKFESGTTASTTNATESAPNRRQMPASRRHAVVRNNSVVAASISRPRQRARCVDSARSSSVPRATARAASKGSPPNSSTTAFSTSAADPAPP